MIIIGIVSANRPIAIESLLIELKQQTLVSSSIKTIVFNGTSEKNCTVFLKYKKLEKAYPSVEFINKEGGPALGRFLIFEKVRSEDVLILLDDDTFPQTINTLQQLVDILDENDIDILSGVWNCQKQKHRPYGYIIHDLLGIYLREPTKVKGRHRVDIPLATMALKGSICSKLEIDKSILFYGDMFDIGVSIKNLGLKCYYDSSVVFEHRNIPNDKDAKVTRYNNQWDYLAKKWGKTVTIGNRLFIGKSMASKSSMLPNQPAKLKPRAFVVELNQYHFETIPFFCKLLYDKGYEVYACFKKTKLLVFHQFPKLKSQVKQFVFHKDEQLFNFLLEKASDNDVCLLNSSGKVFRSGSDEYYSCVNIEQLVKVNIFQSDRLIAIHHDAKKVSNVDANKYKEVCLQPFMSKLHKIPFVTPAYIEVEKAIKINSERGNRRFIMAGLVESKRRNYQDIIQAFINLSIKYGRRDFVLDLCGFAPFPERSWLEKIMDKIKTLNIEECFIFPKFSGGKISSEEFNKRLSLADFFLLGLDPYNVHHSSYLRSKSTGGLDILLTKNLIPIMHKYYSIAFNLPKGTIIYENNHLEDILSYCINMSDKDIHLKKSEVYDTYQLKLSDSKKVFDEILP